MAADSGNRFVTVKVRNISRWIEVICELQHQSGKIQKTGCFYEPASPWIYRGQANADWPIRSSFEVRIGEERWKQEDEDSLKNVEDASIAIFRARAKVMGIEELYDEVDWLAQMQHYGCPTRFVDFTEVPLIALFHALDNEKEKMKPFAIYAVARDNVLGVEFWKDPYQDKPEKISDCSEDLHYDLDNARKIANWLINPRLYKKPKDDTEAKMFCVYPTFANRRLEVQSGLFLMQRHLGSSFEEDLQSVLSCQKKEACGLSQFRQNLADKSYYESLRVIKFVFSKSLRTKARTLLHAAGITHKTMYPDFEGMAKYVKETCFVSAKDNRIEVVALPSHPKINMPLKLPERGVKREGGDN